MAAGGWVPIGQMPGRDSIGAVMAIIGIVVSIVIFPFGLLIWLVIWLGRGRNVTVTYRRRDD